MTEVVLITGASAGLGEEFAFQLAKQGFSLLLVARRQQNLQQVQQQILAKYPDIDVFNLSVDLTQSDAAQQIVDYIEHHSLLLSGLINNAGFGQRGAFSKIALIRQMEMLQVNINSLVSLTHLAIPLLKAQQNSFIINVASTAAFQAGPNLAVYYASKAFVLSFSQALYEELKGEGIQVSTLCPGATKTEFAQVAEMSESLLFKLRVMEKQPVVNCSLANMDKAVVIPGLLNKLSVFFVRLLPGAVARKLAYLIQK
ncbi:MAG: SDR family NAD(P)-dependent oxidoreductase [Psychromonas sp.]|nr:SDR family NAD(P)-dependent oxidoreductase [Psychromonas sp.]